MNKVSIIIGKLKAKYEVNSRADCNKHNMNKVPAISKWIFWWYQT